METPWTVISDENYCIVEDPLKLAFEAQDCQRVLAGASVGAPSGCQLAGGPFLKLDPQHKKLSVLNSV